MLGLRLKRKDVMLAIVLAALPLLLLAWIAERRSWRAYTVRATGDVFQITFSPDGEHLAVASHARSGDHAGSIVEMWDVLEPHALRQPTLSDRRALKAPYAGSIAFSPHAPLLASASYSHEFGVRLWDTNNGRLLRTLPKSSEGGSYLSFWPDRHTLTYWSYRGISQQDIRTGQMRRRLTPGRDFVQLPTAYSPDGKTLAKGTDTNSEGYGMVGDSVQLRDTRTGRLLRKLMHTAREDSYYGLNALAFSPQGDQLVTAHTRYGSSNQNYEISLWSVADGKPLWRVPQSEQTFSFAFSPDGNTLALCNSKEKIALYNTRSGLLEQTFVHGGQVVTIAFSPDGSTLAAGSSGGSVRLWRVR